MFQLSRFLCIPTYAMCSTYFFYNKTTKDTFQEVEPKQILFDCYKNNNCRIVPLTTFKDKI